MVFHSHTFILYFLPVLLIGYHILNHFGKFRLSMLFLGLMSLWFYGAADFRFVPILLASVVVNYFIHRMILRAPTSQVAARICLILGIAFNLSALAYFKYFGFVLANLSLITKHNYVTDHIILPIGISFYTFQQVSFLVDTFHHEIERPYDFLHYFTYMVYFPKLSEGPISSHNDLIPQLMDPDRKRLNWDNLAQGFYGFSLGLGKKMILADAFGKAADWGFSHVSELGGLNAFIVTLAFTLQIYFDFSGYCDMASGISKMMNIDLPDNFNAPYKALNLQDFWRRWHITLNGFFTKYVYIPLGGNRKGRVRTYINIMVVFSLSGLWHGANWHFVIWGLGHGLLLILYLHFKRHFDQMHPVLCWFITFNLVNILWVFFRTGVSDAVTILKQIARMDAVYPISKELTNAFSIPIYDRLVTFLSFPDIRLYLPEFSLLGTFSVAFIILLGFDTTINRMKRFSASSKRAVPAMVFSAFLFTYCILNMNGVTQFIYNAF